MTRTQGPGFSSSLALLAFVVAGAILVSLRTPSSPERASALARATAWNLLTTSGSGAPPVYTKGEFVGVGTPLPNTALHVSRKHPDILKVENDGTGGSAWVFQVGGNGWQDGNLMIKNVATNKHGVVIEPSGRLIVMGDMVVRGALTSAQPPATPAKDTKELKSEVDTLRTTVEKLQAKIAEPAAKRPPPPPDSKKLEAEVKELRDTVEKMQARIVELEAKRTRSNKP
ncbi:MAG: hypothetical protein ACKOTB_12265 [Planctomycetia bacterium]